MIVTDYLVIGAGAASLAFVDTLLTEQPSANVVIVDIHSLPGGHWVDAYGFVHLHQPSLLYGVASKQLEGNWLKLLLTKQQLPWKHRASQTEILAYYQKLMNRWVSSGRVQYFPNYQYDFAHDHSKDDVHKIDSLLDGSSKQKSSNSSYFVKVNVKLVNGILGECKVPSQCPVPFPVDDSITLMTPNQLHDAHYSDSVRDEKEMARYIPLVNCHNNSKNNTPKKKYVVLGCGKTGMDTVVFLQRTMGVHPDDIIWVVPNDVWMLMRNVGPSPYAWAQALVEKNLDFDKAALLLEEQGAFVRISKTVTPTRFRFPVVDSEELSYLKKVKNVIRRGRVTGLSRDDVTDDIRVEFGANQDYWNVSNDHVFVHCTSPGPFNGNTATELFVSDKAMNLFYLLAPPVPISMSCLAMLESARRKGTLDSNFGRKLILESGAYGVSGKNLTENDVLRLWLPDTTSLPTLKASSNHSSYWPCFSLSRAKIQWTATTGSKETVSHFLVFRYSRDERMRTCSAWQASTMSWSIQRMTPRSLPSSPKSSNHSKESKVIHQESFVDLSHTYPLIPQVGVETSAWCRCRSARVRTNLNLLCIARRYSNCRKIGGNHLLVVLQVLRDFERHS